MADLDLLSYERDSRWMPHLSWAYPDWTLQEKMAQQAAQREQAWQRITDQLGPLIIGSGPMVNCGVGGSTGSFGQSDFIVRDFETEEQGHLEGAYEKAPLMTTNVRTRKQTFASNQRDAKLLNNNHQRATRHNYQSLNKTNHNNTNPVALEQKQSILNPNHHSDSIDSLRPSQTPVFSEKRSQSSGIDVEYIEQIHQKQRQSKHQQHNQYLYQVQQQYNCESLKKAKRRCWAVSGLLILLVILLFTLVILMAFGVIQYKAFPRLPL